MENDLLVRLNDIRNYLKKMREASERNAKGLRAMKERGFSQEGMLDKVIEVTAIQSQQIRTLARVVLFYASSSQFSSQLASAMVLQHEMDNKDTK